jgi:hypothetical protein
MGKAKVSRKNDGQNSRPDWFRKILRPAFSLVILLPFSCSSGPRVLSAEEMSARGLNGVIYDVRVCPHEHEVQGTGFRVTGPCELVTCEPVGATLRCVAEKEPEPRSRSVK